MDFFRTSSNRFKDQILNTDFISLIVNLNIDEAFYNHTKFCIPEYRSTSYKQPQLKDKIWYCAKYTSLGEMKKIDRHNPVFRFGISFVNPENKSGNNYTRFNVDGVITGKWSLNQNLVAPLMQYLFFDDESLTIAHHPLLSLSHLCEAFLHPHKPNVYNS